MILTFWSVSWILRTISTNIENFVGKRRENVCVCEGRHRGSVCVYEGSFLFQVSSTFNSVFGSIVVPEVTLPTSSLLVSLRPPNFCSPFPFRNCVSTSHCSSVFPFDPPSSYTLLRPYSLEPLRLSYQWPSSVNSVGFVLGVSELWEEVYYIVDWSRPLLWIRIV